MSRAAPSSTQTVSAAIEATGTCLEASPVHLHGEIVALHDSQNGFWAQVADEVAVADLFVPRSLLKRAGCELGVGQLIEVRARRRHKKAECQWHLAARFIRVLQEVGPLAQDDQLNLEQLEAEGILSSSSLHNFAFAKPHRVHWQKPSKVLVLTSEGSAGWGDFRSRLGSLLDATSTLIETRWVRMQGSEMVVDITSALAQIEAADADMVFIVRGGGSWAKMRAFDDPYLARAIAACPIEVVTAIGHKRDVHLADRVASQAFATPQAAGEALAKALSWQTRTRWKQNLGKAAAQAPVSPTDTQVDRERQQQLQNERARWEAERRIHDQTRNALAAAEANTAAVWRFADRVLVSAARDRVESRSRWLALGAAATALVALLAAGYGGWWARGGWLVALGSMTAGAYAAAGPRRGKTPATQRLARRRPLTAQEWVDRVQVARTPRELRALTPWRPPR